MTEREFLERNEFKFRLKNFIGYMISKFDIHPTEECIENLIAIIQPEYSNSEYGQDFFDTVETELKEHYLHGTEVD